MKIEFEATEETVDIVNKVLVGFLTVDNELTSKQKNSVEQFRRNLILPFAVESEYPITTAFAKFFDVEVVQVEGFLKKN